jgi:hypothetical protein
MADVPAPKIPKGNAEKCVEPTQEMRVNHMNYILHQRDETMHRGIRTKQHSFKNCINCHTVKDDAGKAVNFKDERHFCNSCHSYAAVKIDCFECHASTPTAKGNGDAHGNLNTLIKMSAAGSKDNE